MQYSQSSSGPLLREFVECFWSLQDSSGAVQRIVPDGYPALILNLGEPFESFHGGQWSAQPLCFFAGQITGPLLIRSNGPAKILGVGFLPQGASRLFGAPMDQLTDCIVPMSELSRTLAMELESVHEAAPGLPQRVRFEEVLTRFAMKSRAEDLLVSHAVCSMVNASGSLDIGTMAGRLGLSLRQFERRFRGSVGISPKLFSRIQRFQSVFLRIERDERNWADAAVMCGYYDQAHLIRDFRDFAGEPPVALLEEADLARHFLRHAVMSHSSNTPALESR